MFAHLLQVTLATCPGCPTARLASRTDQVLWYEYLLLQLAPLRSHPPYHPPRAIVKFLKGQVKVARRESTPTSWNYCNICLHVNGGRTCKQASADKNMNLYETLISLHIEMVPLIFAPHFLFIPPSIYHSNSSPKITWRHYPNVHCYYTVNSTPNRLNQISVGSSRPRLYTLRTLAIFQRLRLDDLNFIASQLYAKAAVVFWEYIIASRPGENIYWMVTGLGHFPH